MRATDLKNGATFLSNDKPYQVIKYALIKMGRGGAIVKVTARNLESGSIEEKSFSSNVTVEEINTLKRQLQYLYKDSLNAVFMDPKSYEQVDISLNVLGEQILYLKEGGNATVLFWSLGDARDKEDKPLSIELPPKVTFTVKETDPGVKGNSATNIYKSAVLSNGSKLKVPLFIEVGDKITLDTRTGEYLERAK